MQDRQPNLFTREDTFFGVCEALGEDLGIHANWLRIAVALALFWHPVEVIAGYLIIGVIVAVARWLFPPVRRAPAPAEAAQAAPATADEQIEPEPMPLAA